MAKEMGSGTAAAIGLILVSLGVIALIAYEYGFVPPIGPPYNPPPIPKYSIAVIFKMDTTFNWPTPVPGETLKVENTGETVTSTDTANRTLAPKVHLEANFMYTFTATTYGPFPPQGIATQLSKNFLTPTDLSEQYAIVVTVAVGGSYPNWPYPVWYGINKIELIPWTIA